MTTTLIRDRSVSGQQPLALPPPLPGGDVVSKTALQQLSKQQKRALRKAQFQQQKEVAQGEQSRRVLTLFEQAFADTRLSPVLIQLIDTYAELESDLEYPIPFISRFYLHEKDALKEHFSPACRTPAHFQAAARILEVSDKLAHKPEGTRLYALFSEPLIYAFELLKGSKGKTVLDLGAGRAFASLLLGFSDADTIYVNDQDKVVLDLFVQERDKTPPNVRKKFQVLHGDCLQGKIWKSIKDPVDLVLCGNLIHFFNSNQMKVFFKELHRKLKPGGEGIFFTDTSQGYYNFQSQSVEDVDVLDRNLTCFEANSFCVFDKSDKMLHLVLHHMANRSEQTYVPKTTKTVIYQRRAHDLWVQTPDYARMDSKLKKMLDAHLKDSPEKGRDLAGKKIMMATFVSQLFNKKSLTHLFADNGFEVVTVFYLNNEGHLEQDLRCVAIDRIGIICRKPKSTS